MGILKRLLFIVVVPIYFVSIFSMVGPILYWIITGKEFGDYMCLIDKYLDWLDV
jgi:hypothetical protein